MANHYDLWVDFASMADDGTLWTQSANLRRGLRVAPGDVVRVGSEDAVPARAQVISVEGGAIVVKIIDDETAVAQSA
jgi:hypothetical protein